MALSIKQLEKIVGEIGTDLVGGFLRRIDQPQPGGVLFEIERRGKRVRLFFSAHRQHARCHLSTQKYINPKKPPRFCQLLRAHLRHKQVLSFEQLQGDRIIQMRMAWTQSEGLTEISFIAELTGASSNLFLIDAKGLILGSLFSSRKGALSTGTIYRVPELKRLPSFKESNIPFIESWNCSVEMYYRALEEKEKEEAEKRGLLSKLDQEIRLRRKRLDSLSVSLSEAEKSSVFRIHGEILKSHLHEIKPGAHLFKFLDPSNPNDKTLVIKLAPALTPSENMLRFFERYKKGVSAKTALMKTIENIQNELAQLEADKKTVIQNGMLAVVSAPLLASQSRKDRTGKKGGPPVYLSSDEMRLIVGRNDRENEWLTFRHARGNDLWFHARDVPGSHLVVRMEGRKEIPYQSLLDAAMLALHFSQYRKSGKGEVIYTYKKYVRKPKNGLPGSVVCAQELTIFIQVELARLTRILQSRIETGIRDCLVYTMTVLFLPSIFAWYIA